MDKVMEAIVKNGRIEPLIPLPFEEGEKFLLVPLQGQNSKINRDRKLEAFKKSKGSMKGKLSSVDEFILNKKNEKDLED